MDQLLHKLFTWLDYYIKCNILKIKVLKPDSMQVTHISHPPVQLSVTLVYMNQHTVAIHCIVFMDKNFTIVLLRLHWWKILWLCCTLSPI